jgi:hypothetical protein
MNSSEISLSGIVSPHCFRPQPPGRLLGFVGDRRLDLRANQTSGLWLCGNLTPEMMQNIVSGMLIGRTVKREEVSYLVAFVASHQANEVKRQNQSDRRPGDCRYLGPAASAFTAGYVAL